jgi:hypothetical protein
MYSLQRPTKKKVPTSPFQILHSSCTNQTNLTHSARCNLCSNNQAQLLLSHKYMSTGELERICKQGAVTCTRYSPNVCLGVHRKERRDVSQNVLYLSQDSNRATTGCFYSIVPRPNTFDAKVIISDGTPLILAETLRTACSAARSCRWENNRGMMHTYSAGYEPPPPPGDNNMATSRTF